MVGTLRTARLDEAVDLTLERTGGRVVCGTPLGLGKPVPLLNALYLSAARPTAVMVMPPNR